MKLTDEETQGSGFGGEEIAVERVDRLAEWLEMTLGTRLTAFAAGLSTREVVKIAHGDEQPSPVEEQRLRNLFAVASLLAARDGAGSAYAWLTEPNEDLGGRSPASLLHEGGTPESVWFAAAPTF
ncbi:MAG: hypothetical protein QOH72_1477 [Solirubrobacteraceae bacterium]|jgi:uncharacterized protein (DUF2384 family)|nr:hypothetical protein [Solirubrobacteraceae bacterium]